MPEKLTIIALPHAGGASFNYHPIRNCMPENVEFVAVDPPGHGTRIGEPLFTSIHEMADDIIKQYKEDMLGEYILFGHSMGATLAYEICCRICSSGGKLPEMLVVSGRPGPLVENSIYYADLPREQFIDMLKSLGCVPDELIEHPELFALFESILRADFKAIESYSPSSTRRLPVPITVLSGREDDIPKAQLESWTKITMAQTDIHIFPGGHFFLFDCAQEVAEILTQNAPEIEAARIAT